MRQHQLHVAGDAPAELVRTAGGFIEGRHVQTVHPAQHRGHGLGRGPQHVHVGIEHRARAAAGAGVDLDGRRRGIDPAGGKDTGPQNAKGPQAGNLQEKIRTHAEVEMNTSGGFFNRDAPGFHLTQGVHGRGQDQPQAQGAVGAAIVPGILEHRQGLQPGRLAGSPAR